jgi:hypothetical protein
MAFEPIVRWKQQLGGVILATLGLVGTASAWHVALTEGYFRTKYAGFMLAAVVMGLALIFFPGYKEERVARGEDISGLSEMQLMTPRWWVVLLVCIVAALGNLALLRFA